jgi:hypothetical protein
MNVMIQFTAAEERKALPLLLRRTSGRILPGGRYVLDDSALSMLRRAGVKFKRIADSNAAKTAKTKFKVRTGKTRNRRVGA